MIPDYAALEGRLRRWATGDTTLCEDLREAADAIAALSSLKREVLECVDTTNGVVDVTAAVALARRLSREPAGPSSSTTPRDSVPHQVDPEHMLEQERDGDER